MAAFTASFEFRLQTEDAKKVFDLELCWFEYLIAFSPLLFFNQRFWLAFAILHGLRNGFFLDRVLKTLLFICALAKGQCSVPDVCV